MHFSYVLCIKMTFTDFIYMLCYMIGISIINKWYCVCTVTWYCPSRILKYAS